MFGVSRPLTMRLLPHVWGVPCATHTQTPPPLEYHPIGFVIILKYFVFSDHLLHCACYHDLVLVRAIPVARFVGRTVSLTLAVPGLGLIAAAAREKFMFQSIRRAAPTNAKVQNRQHRTCQYP